LNRFKQLFKRNAYFMVTLIVLILSIIFAGLTLAIFSIGNSVDQTSLGFIYLGSYNEDRYDSIINHEVDMWMDNADYKIQYQDYIYTIDLNRLDFDLEQTLLHIIKNQENKAYFNLSIDHLLMIQNEIDAQFTSAITTTFKEELFISDLMNDVSDLKNRKIYNLVDYLDQTIATTILDQVEMKFITSTDINAIISQVNTIYITANERFSLLDRLGYLPLTNEQLSIIASGIQAVTMNTNLNGFVFEQNYSLPIWASGGQNVRILRVNQFDFTFYNGFDLNYQISIEKINDTTLEFTLLGYPLVTEYETVPVFQVSIPYQTIYIYNEDINELTENVMIIETDTDYTYRILIQTGIEGYVSFFMRTATRLGETGITSKLFDEEMLPITEIYYENIVEKEGN